MTPLITSYRTVKNRSEGVYKEKGSKFLGYLFPLANENNIKAVLEIIKSEHPKARHHCYAYRKGHESIIERANDDGEPAGSAGLPILNQLKSKELTNSILIVVRYFGGTKLGVSGLIQAYKQASIEAIQHAIIITKELSEVFVIMTEYSHVNEIYKLTEKFDGKILSQKYNEQSILEVDIPLRHNFSFLKSVKENSSLQLIAN